LQADVKESVKTMKVKGSEDNEVFYDYLRFLAGLRPEADTLRAQLSRTKGNVADSTRIADQLNGMDKRVKKSQADLCDKYPNSLVSKIVRSAIEPEPPAFTGTEKEKQTKRYYWYRAHYFDNIDLADPAMLRSPVLHGKIDGYITKVTPQHPDSINIALDDLLNRVKNSPETYKYYLVHYLNFYAKSKLVGFDACYVHLAKNYYCKNTPPWMKKEDVEKICDNAMRLDPILIGRIAPNITVMDRNNKPHSLWEVDADYTVLFFWASDCGHCKKAAPYMIEFAKAYKDKGVKVFAVCTDYGEKAAAECWKSVDEKGFTDDLFMTMQDAYQRSRFKSLYDVQTTPQVFILDRKHEILMKRVGAEELSKVMDQVMRFQEEKKKQGK
jgi:thiol-disulfide isomerase/thioredoxin